MPNPYYVPELKRLTGLDVAVRDYVMNAAATEEFWRRLTPIVDYLLPQYRQEGRTELVLAVGCTGGRHRSVAVAHRLAAYIDALGFPWRKATGIWGGKCVPHLRSEQKQETMYEQIR